MATKKSPPTKPADVEARSPRPVVPEVDASRLKPAALGPFKGGIITDSRGRCAVCRRVADHVHAREA